MRSILTIILILVSSLLTAQNLHIGLGVAVTEKIVDLKDYNGDLRSSKGTNTYFNPVNLLFEFELGNHLALKTGSYLLLNKGHYTYTVFEGVWINGIRQSVKYEMSDDFNFMSLDIPVLLTFKSHLINEKYGLNLNIGPYMGYIISFPQKNYVYGDSPKIKCGLNMSAGFGTRNWQMNCYILSGRINIPLYPSVELIKEKSTSFGINLTRVLHFSKKEPKSQ